MDESNKNPGHGGIGLAQKMIEWLYVNFKFLTTKNLKSKLT